MNENEVVVFETPHWRVVLIPDQYYLGRCVVVLKRPCGDLAGLAREELLDWHEVLMKLQDLLRRTFNPTYFNWSCLMNDAYNKRKPQPPQPQVHWHFRPRYQFSIEFGGETFTDEKFGENALSGGETVRIVSGEMLEAINLKLQENF